MPTIYTLIISIKYFFSYFFFNIFNFFFFLLKHLVCRKKIIRNKSYKHEMKNVSVEKTVFHFVKKRKNLIVLRRNVVICLFNRLVEKCAFVRESYFPKAFFQHSNLWHVHAQYKTIDFIRGHWIRRIDKNNGIACNVMVRIYKKRMIH